MPSTDFNSHTAAQVFSSYSQCEFTQPEAIQEHINPGCLWTGSSRSICLFLCWSWLGLEPVSTSWSLGFKMLTSGVTSPSSTSLWCPH
ncbi:hypothetical protein PHYPO_G00153140 [Pangasianodon hypophthalmus]|uniref:Uncharacterized protein n=1 Tax=Pangasianodon hypophthalmus TaxID=310915 RepID=A0A5N5JWJ4_PANHP|nr:hypothetical protein PHYPO_G00153140 [Pangasianodon hypophthalmus]